MPKPGKMSADRPSGNYLTKNIRAFADDVPAPVEAHWKFDVVRIRYCSSARTKARRQRGNRSPLRSPDFRRLATKTAVYSADACTASATNIRRGRTLWEASVLSTKKSWQKEGLV